MSRDLPVLCRKLLPRSFQDSLGPATTKNDDWMSNYRPTSNLCTMSKITERTAVNRQRPHLLLLSASYFSRLQLAYLSGYFTQTSLLHVLNTVLSGGQQESHRSRRIRHISAKNRQITTLESQCIQAKTSLKHDVVIKRLETQIGVCSAASSWLRFYLTNRRTRS